MWDDDIYDILRTSKVSCGLLQFMPGYADGL